MWRASAQHWLDLCTKAPCVVGCRPSIHRASNLAVPPNCAAQRGQGHINGTPIIVLDCSKTSVCASFATHLSSLPSARRWPLQCTKCSAIAAISYHRWLSVFVHRGRFCRASLLQERQFFLKGIHRLVHLWCDSRHPLGFSTRFGRWYVP